jgi:hypothetical protein
MWPNVDWNDLVQRMLPEWWRKARLFAWMRVLLSPVVALHTAFLAYRSRVLYELRLNGQTMYLEKALNDRFDDDERRIYIETIEDPSQFYLYRKVEDRDPVYIYPKWNVTRFFFVGAFARHQGKVWVCTVAGSGVEPGPDSASWDFHKDFDTYLRRKGESLQGVDFIVWVPLGLVYDTPELRALVDRYKQAGKRYIISTIP